MRRMQTSRRWQLVEEWFHSKRDRKPRRWIQGSCCWCQGRSRRMPAKSRWYFKQSMYIVRILCANLLRVPHKIENRSFERSSSRSMTLTGRRIRITVKISQEKAILICRKRNVNDLTPPNKKSSRTTYRGCCSDLQRWYFWHWAPRDLSWACQLGTSAWYNPNLFQRRLRVRRKVRPFVFHWGAAQPRVRWRWYNLRQNTFKYGTVIRDVRNKLTNEIRFRTRSTIVHSIAIHRECLTWKWALDLKGPIVGPPFQFFLYIKRCHSTRYAIIINYEYLCKRKCTGQNAGITSCFDIACQHLSRKKRSQMERGNCIRLIVLGWTLEAETYSNLT